MSNPIGGMKQVDREQMEQLAVEFLHQTSNDKKLKGLVGKQSRINIHLDEIRNFNPKLADYVLRHPIEAIKIFED